MERVVQDDRAMASSGAYSRRYLEQASRYVPMWSVHGPGLGDRLYRNFSGRRAEQRAEKFADSLGPGHFAAAGMGSRSGWVSMEQWAKIRQEIDRRQMPDQKLAELSLGRIFGILSRPFPGRRRRGIRTLQGHLLGRGRPRGARRSFAELRPRPQPRRRRWMNQGFTVKVTSIAAWTRRRSTTFSTGSRTGRRSFSRPSSSRPSSAPCPTTSSAPPPGTLPSPRTRSCTAPATGAPGSPGPSRLPRQVQPAVRIPLRAQV